MPESSQSERRIPLESTGALGSRRRGVSLQVSDLQKVAFGRCGASARGPPGPWNAMSVCGAAGFGRPGEVLDDHDPKERRPRPLRPRLARHPPHLLLRRLLGPRARELPGAQGPQRGPRRPGCGLRHARAQRHGDRLVRPLGPARPQGQPRDGLHDRPGRRPVHERRDGREAQRVQRLEDRPGPLRPDLDRPRPARVRAALRPEDVRGVGEAREAPPRRLRDRETTGRSRSGRT